MDTHATNVCTERRRFERVPCARPCKVLHPASMRYMAARTLDFSPGGALLELSQHRPLRSGDRVDVMIDWDQRGVVGRETTREAVVVRTGEPEGLRQRVGVAFLAEQAAHAAA
jgi:hypothetical protein